jgi:hypothetical protein
MAATNPPEAYLHNSEHWLSDILRLFLAFTRNLKGKPGGAGLELDVAAVNTKLMPQYREGLARLKQSMYGPDAGDAKIDRHKIIALYIKTVFELRPFSIDYKGCDVSWNSLLANEYFCLALIAQILGGWNNGGHLVMDRKDKMAFVVLLNYHFEEKIPINVIDLAQLIYYIELTYFR